MALRPQQVAPELLNKVTKALGITALGQWYYVSHYTASKAIGARALNKFGGSVASFLKHAYPQHQFDEEKLALTRGQEKDQKFIEVIIRKLFPNVEIFTKARKAVGIINPETGAHLEIDFWIPSLKLGIEYQDKHHFGYQWYANDTLENYQKRDDIKKATMSSLGYTLITIGYWWDKSIESIAVTIRKYRPDLLLEYKHNPAEPIPTDPPVGGVTSSVIPGVAGIMNPFIPSYNFDPTNWYGGEKHDGIRGVYNPNLNKMFSRSGNELSVLPSLLNDIPNMLIEGEITAGRGNYNKTAALSNHTQQDKVNWPMFRYVVYDIPDAEFGTYTRRYSAITKGVLAQLVGVFTQLAFRILLVSKSHLKILVDTIICDGGEGVIAQQDAQYEYGRAKGLAKIKVRRDADAQVLHVNKRSCTCKLVNDVVVDIIFCDDFDASNLEVGDIVSFYHKGYTQSEMPKQGEIYKIRYDITWEQLISDTQNAVKRRPPKEVIGSLSLSDKLAVTRNKTGHWNKASNVRKFFDEFARTMKFDPRAPENWYSVKYTELRNAGASGLLYAYNYNVKKALIRAYPELKLDETKFSPRVRKGYWNKATNVREFFDEFARTTGFDPLVPENWYPVRSRSVQARGSGLLKHYSLLKALSFAYPNLKFEGRKFRVNDKTRATKGHWHTAANVRSFLDEFARTAGFDPLAPDNWYSIRTRTVQQAGGRGMLKFYSLSKALSVAYPELKFDAAKFRQSSNARVRNKNGHWNESQNVREFLDKFARRSGFDPLVPNNWYTIKVGTLRHSKGGSLLSAHGYNLKQALTIAYPELKFEEAKFRKPEKL